MTRVDMVTNYLATLATQGKSPNTIAAYSNDLRHFCAYLDARLSVDTEWDMITAEHIQDYLDGMLQKGYKTATVARHTVVLRNFLFWLKNKKNIEIAKDVVLRHPKIERRLPALLTEEQVQHLFSVIGQDNHPDAMRDRIMLELMYAAGLRVSELIDLRVRDVDVEQNAIRCCSGEKSARTIYLPSRLGELLKQYIKSNPSKDEQEGEDGSRYLFSRDKKPVDRHFIWKITKYYANMAGYASWVKPYTLRHSRVAHLVSKGERVHRVREMLGYSTITKSRRYLDEKTDHFMENRVPSSASTSEYPTQIQQKADEPVASS